MTCDVAVMNTRRIALAADSAVALGDGEKVYHNAEKLLRLARSAPVGIMTFGSADLMDVLWEAIVAGYRQHFGEGKFATLAEYLEDFVGCIEVAEAMSRPRCNGTASETSRAGCGTDCTPAPGRKSEPGIAAAKDAIRTAHCGD